MVRLSPASRAGLAYLSESWSFARPDRSGLASPQALGCRPLRGLGALVREGDDRQSWLLAGLTHSMCVSLTWRTAVAGRTT